MAHIILTGATGTVGAAVLAHAISSPAISRISILTRRPVKLADNEPKAKVIIHDDFEKYPADLLHELKDATGCIWAQGISSSGMKEEDYALITVDYPVAAAKAFSSLGHGMNFVYISGEGAVMPPDKGFGLYSRVKGQAERALLELQAERSNLRVFNIRPATINPQGKYITERKPTLHDRLSTGLGGIFEKVWKSFVIPVDKLAGVLVDLAAGDGKPLEPGEGIEADGHLLRNTAIRRLAGM